MGLSLGAGSARAVQLSRRKARGHAVALPDGAISGGEIGDPELLADGLRQLWREAKFTSRQVVVGMSGHDVVARQVVLPPLATEDVRQALEYELSDLIPFPLDETVFDYRSVPKRLETADSTVGETVLVVAAWKDSVAQMTRTLRAAGLRVAAVDYQPFGVLRAAAAPRPLDEHGLVVEVGSDTLSVVTHRQGVATFARTVATAVDSSMSGEIEAELVLLERFRRRAAGADDVAVDTDRPEPLLEAIRGTIEYALAHDPVPLTKVTLLGDQSRCAELAPDLSRVLSAPVELVDPLDEEQPIREAPFLGMSETSTLASAYGLAVEGDDAHRGPRRLNLAVKRRRHASSKVLAPIGVAAGVVVLLAGATQFAPRPIETQEQLTAAENRLGVLRDALNDPLKAAAATTAAEALRQQVVVLDDSRLEWQQLLSEVEAAAPPNSLIISIDATTPGRATDEAEGAAAVESAEQGRATFVVASPQPDAPSEWLEALEGINGLRDPWLVSATTQDGVFAMTLIATVEMPDLLAVDDSPVIESSDG